MEAKHALFTATLLLSPVASADDAKTTEQKAMGNVSVLRADGIAIHTVYGVANSHVIETRNEVRVVDAHLALDAAQALKAYVESLGKPVKQVILSHNHPDHWFGSQVLAQIAPVATSRNVADDLKHGGGRYLKGPLAKRLKDNMPGEVIVPSETVALGEQTWDGVNVVVEEFPEHEAHHSLVIKLPDHGVMIGQDLFYNEMFLVASERQRNKNWVRILRNFQKSEAKDFPHVLVGHGKNTDPGVFQQDIDYLEALEGTLAKGLSKEETQAALIEMFPRKGGKGMLGISMRNLFRKAH